MLFTSLSLFENESEVKPQGARKPIAETKKPQDLVWFKGRQVDAAFLSDHYTQAVQDFKTAQSVMATHLPEPFQDKEMELEREEGTGEILTDTDVKGKERPWKMHKKESVRVADLFEKARLIDGGIISDSRLQSLKDCASALVFAADSAGNKRLKTANFCRVRLCPMCSWRRSVKLFGQTARVAGEMLERYPKTRFLFLTLTVKNCKDVDLQGVLKNMDKAFSYITAASRTFAAAKDFKKNLLGYMRATEITYNQHEDTYHPHFHCILAVKSTYFGRGYMNHDEWRELWKAAAGLDYEPEVRIQTIQAGKQNGMAGAVAEVAKYPVKASALLEVENEDRAVDALIVLARAMQNRRMVTFGGVFKTIRAELKMQNVEAENADLKNTEQDDEKSFTPVKLIFFKWRVKVGAYIC